MIVIALIAIGVTYSPKSPISETNQASIQKFIPNTIDNFFIKNIGKSSLTSGGNPSLNKLGKPTIACTSDSMCKQAYPNSINVVCNLQDGYCYSGGNY